VRCKVMYPPTVFSYIHHEEAREDEREGREDRERDRERERERHARTHARTCDHGATAEYGSVFVLCVRVVCEACVSLLHMYARIRYIEDVTASMVIAHKPRNYPYIRAELPCRAVSRWSRAPALDLLCLLESLELPRARCHRESGQSARKDDEEREQRELESPRCFSRTKPGIVSSLGGLLPRTALDGD